MSNHQEHLRIRDLGEDGLQLIGDQSGDIVVGTGRSTNYDQTCGTMEPEDARRIAACWNFCIGISTEDLENLPLPDYVARQAFLTGTQPTEEGSLFGVKGIAAQMLASMFAGQFIGSGAVNFLEVHLTHAETGPMTVTIQRRNGKTPGQLKADADAEVSRLRAALGAIATSCDVSTLGEAIAAAKEALA